MLKYSEWHVVVSDNFVNKSSLIKKILRHNIKLNTRRLFLLANEEAIRPIFVGFKKVKIKVRLHYPGSNCIIPVQLTRRLFTCQLLEYITMTTLNPMFFCKCINLAF